MKAKHALMFSLIFIPLCSAARILQYIFVIDKNGYFRPENGFHTALIYILYAALALAAVFSLCMMFTGSREKAAPEIFSGRLCGALFIGAGALMVADFGISAGIMLRTSVLNAAAILELLSAVYFAMTGYGILSKSKLSKSARIFGLFAPVYIIVYAVSEFFSSFEKVHVSQTKLSMLTICAMALLFTTIVLLFSGMNITKKRLCAVCALYAVIASPTAFADLFAAVSGKTDMQSPVKFILNILIQLIFILLSITALIRADNVSSAPVCDQTDDESDLTDIENANLSE